MNATKTTPTWIDGTGNPEEVVGSVWFLSCATRHNERGAERWMLYGTPLRTNQSHEPRLHGWCGETNNVSHSAHGMVRIARVAASGRLAIKRLSGADLAQALEAAGFPGLE